MATKNSNKLRPEKGSYSNRPKVKKRVEELEEPSVENSVDESESTVEETTTEQSSVEETTEKSEKASKEPCLSVVYDQYTGPKEESEEDKKEPSKETQKDTKEKGMTLVIILSVIILLTLGFLVYYEHSWRLQEQQETVIDSKYDELQNVVRTYIASMKDPNKVQLAKQLSEVYVKMSTAPGDINTIEESILEQSQEILGFNEPGYSSKTDYEYEWQHLFDATGIVNTWLINAGIIITKDNQKDVFMAIAKGLN